jgi:outer membrane protein assembly factor BamB
VRRVVCLLALAALAAGCGARHEAAPPSHQGSVTSDRGPTTVRRAAPDVARPKRPPAAVQVTVVDGDLGTRVPGASVRVGHLASRSNGRGVARIRLGRRTALVTVASKRGYGERAVRLSFRTHPKSTIRLYRRSLQWTMYGASPQRTQEQPDIHLRPPFRVVWSRGLGSLVEFPAVVVDGIAYVANAQGTIHALSMADGSVIWTHLTPHGKMASSPAVAGDRLLVHGMDGYVQVLRRSDGHLLWRYPAGSPIESSPVVLPGDLDVFGTWGGTITALDLDTHRLRWTYRDGCKITSSAAVLGGTIFIGDYCGRLLALSARTGALRWSGSVNGRIYGTPAVAGGRVFVPSSDGGSLTAFSIDGTRLWARDTGAYVYSSPAVADGRVFFGSYNGVFYALSARTGATLWARGTGGPISGAAVVVDGVAYAGSFAHRIVGVDAVSGRVLLDFPHGEYVPVAGSGRRLLLHGYSRIFAVEHR